MKLATAWLKENEQVIKRVKPNRFYLVLSNEEVKTFPQELQTLGSLHGTYQYTYLGVLVDGSSESLSYKFEQCFIKT